MCNLFNDGPSPQEIAQQQQAAIQAQENKRQAAIGQGKQSIDQAFSQFDDPYFNKFTKAFTDSGNSQLTDQYGIAKDRLTAALAGRDTLGSSGGNNALAQLDKTNADAQAAIGGQATDATNALKTSVNGQKNALYAQNEAAADPLLAQTEAQAAGTSIVAPRSAPTLSNVFAGVLSPFASAAKSNSQSLFPTVNWNAPTSGPGSSVSA